MLANLEPILDCSVPRITEMFAADLKDGSDAIIIINTLLIILIAMGSQDVLEKCGSDYEFTCQVCPETNHR